MENFSTQELLATLVTEIAPVRFTRVENDRNPHASINPNDHYDVMSFGKVLDSNNDLGPIEGYYKGLFSRNKALVHVIGGKRFIIEEKLG